MLLEKLNDLLAATRLALAAEIRHYLAPDG
jgi:hypothetical protein